MLKKLKKDSLKSRLPIAIIMIIVAMGLLIYFGPDFITWAKGPVVFEDLTIDEIEDQYVTMNFELTFGTFANEVTTTTRNGTKVSEEETMQYHAVLIGGLDRYWSGDEHMEFIGLAVPSRDFDTLSIIDQNSDEFFENYDLRALDTRMQVTGQIFPMDDKILRYYKSFFRSGDYTNEELEAYCSPYYIKIGFLSRGSIEIVIIMNAVAVILLLCALFMLIKALTGGYQRKLVKTLKAQGEMELERADMDFTSAYEPTKSIKIGRSYLFDCSSANTQVIPLRQIAWAYTHQTNHQKYGRTVSTTYNTMIYTEDKKLHQLVIPSKTICDQIMDDLSKKCPAGIFGYSDQLKHMFNMEYDEFTRMRRQKEAEMNPTQDFNSAYADPDQDPFGSNYNPYQNV